MQFSRVLCRVTVLLFLALASFVTPRGESLEESAAFAASRGRLLDVENLTLEQTEYLADGVDVEVGRGGCAVAFGVEGHRKRTFPLESGDRLALGASVETVRVEHVEEERSAAQESEDAPHP